MLKIIVIMHSQGFKFSFKYYDSMILLDHSVVHGSLGQAFDDVTLPRYGKEAAKSNKKDKKSKKDSSPKKSKSKLRCCELI